MMLLLLIDWWWLMITFFGSSSSSASASSGHKRMETTFPSSAGSAGKGCKGKLELTAEYPRPRLSERVGGFNFSVWPPAQAVYQRWWWAEAEIVLVRIRSPATHRMGRATPFCMHLRMYPAVGRGGACFWWTGQSKWKLDVLEVTFGRKSVKRCFYTFSMMLKLIRRFH